jgi:hypothetical protein
MKRDKPGPLAYFWVYVPLLSAVACAGLFVYVLLYHPGPAEPRLLLEVATALAVLLALTSVGSVRGGERLLAEVGPAEPVTFKEAGWNLGAPPGLLVGVLVVLLQHHVQLGSSFMQSYGVPLFLYTAIISLFWATLTRLIVRWHRLSLTDYACALFIPRERYTSLARAKQAWQAARRPLRLTAAEVRESFPDLVLPLAYQLGRTHDEALTAHLFGLLEELGKRAVPILEAALAPATAGTAGPSTVPPAVRSGAEKALARLRGQAAENNKKD